MSATAAYDRTADRDALQQQMDEFARNGGMIEKLDYAGNLVGLEADKPKDARPTAKVLPMPKPTPKKAPVEGFIELDPIPKRDPGAAMLLTPVEVIPEPEVKRRAKVLPFPGRPGKPPTPVAAPAPITPAVDITKALRTLRADAERALAHLNAVFPGCSK